MTYLTIAEIKAANRELGHYFFSPNTMRFFRSRIATKQIFAGRYFITSEQYDEKSPRLYTILEVMPDGSIEIVGNFQQFATLSQAKAAAKRLT